MASFECAWEHDGWVCVKGQGRGGRDPSRQSMGVVSPQNLGWNRSEQGARKVSAGLEQGTHNVENGSWLQCYPTSSESARGLGYPEVGPQNQVDLQAGRQRQCRGEWRGLRNILGLRGGSSTRQTWFEAVVIMRPVTM
jgi:hypothetical protein